MPEIEMQGKKFVELKGFKTIEYICDNCKAGKMIQTGIVLTCNPPLYQHKCDNCGDIKSFSLTYPKTVMIVK